MKKLYETFITRKFWSFYPTCRHKWLPKSIVDLASTLKINSRDVSVSNITVRDDNSNLNEEGCEGNAILQKCLRKEN